MVFSSGIPAVDRYLDEGYAAVPGMSSRFAAMICGHILRRQSEWDISGHVAEIGTFAGRFFIALALALKDGERALGIDTFEWPDAGLLDRFHSFVRRHGVPDDRVIALKADTSQLTSDTILARLGGPIRFFHIDGEHTRRALTHDLDLAYAVLHEKGVIVLDDMLHPGFPMLFVAVMDWLGNHPDMRIVCVIDREDISAAAKFVLCRTSIQGTYENDLMTSFPDQHWTFGADFEQWLGVVLTPHPRLPDLT
jgi:predicted O-methyltransferase YrrM